VAFRLPAVTLERVAALGAELRLDVYAQDDVEREVIEIPDSGSAADVSDPA
jgi:hypothetical protein